MPVTPVKTLIVQTSENGVPVLAEPVLCFVKLL